MVCSPAGTTIEAVAALEREGFRNAIMTAMEECTRRAREIGRKK
jgi:pyrroline-5-carboxylate reductase